LMERPHNAALAALIYTVVIWGITPVMVRSVALALGSYDFLVTRLVISALIFACMLLFTGVYIARKDWPKLAALAMIGLFGYYALTTFGFAYAPAGIGTLIMSTQPMLIALLAFAAGLDKLNAFSIAGLVIAFMGSALLVWGDGTAGGAVSRSDLIIGCALIFAASVAWSTYVVFARPLIQTYGALKITAVTNVLIALPMLPLLRVSMFEKMSAMPPHAIWALLLLFTIGTSSVITWNYAAGHARPTLLGTSLYIMPVVAVGAGWLFLSEPVTLQVIIAAFIILTGVAVSQLGKRA
jgi:drug/metabolite transporter (DMT)-like permease